MGVDRFVEWILRGGGRGVVGLRYLTMGEGSEESGVVVCGNVACARCWQARVRKCYFWVIVNAGSCSKPPCSVTLPV